jgi:hypothetical protein
MDAGCVAGFGVELTHVGFDARYGGGVIDITDGDGLGGVGLLPASERVEYRKREFGLVARVRF